MKKILIAAALIIGAAISFIGAVAKEMGRFIDEMKGSD